MLLSVHFLRDSFRFSLVIVEEAAQQLVPTNGSDFTRQGTLWRLARLVQWDIAERRIVELCEGLHDVIKMAKAEAIEVIQAFALLELKEQNSAYPEASWAITLRGVTPSKAPKEYCPCPDAAITLRPPRTTPSRSGSSPKRVPSYRLRKGYDQAIVRQIFAMLLEGMDADEEAIVEYQFVAENADDPEI